MRTLKQVDFSWPALNRALNDIIDTVNRNSPLEGENIHLDEKGRQGIMINVTNQGKDDKSNANTGGGGGGGIAAPTSLTIQGVSWQSITIVDNVTCAKTQINVLTTQSGSVTFRVTVNTDGTWTLV